MRKKGAQPTLVTAADEYSKNGRKKDKPAPSLKILSNLKNTERGERGD